MGALDGRVAMISGAGTGLGRATAIAFAESGASVVLLGRRLERLEQTASIVLERTGRTSLIIQSDVTDEQQVMGAVESALAEHGRIDILLNNAAVLEPGSVMDLSAEEWQSEERSRYINRFTEDVNEIQQELDALTGKNGAP